MSDREMASGMQPFSCKMFLKKNKNIKVKRDGKWYAAPYLTHFSSLKQREDGANSGAGHINWIGYHF